MKKVKMFLGIACLTVAIGSAAFTKANAKFLVPEYYFFTPAVGLPVCTLAPDFECEFNDFQPNCIKDVSPTQTNKKIYADAGCTLMLQIKP